jgi:ribosomal protein S18 acetylase RimI-like enzyme
MTNEGKVIFTGKTSKGLDVTLRYPMRSDLHALWEFINALSQERTYILFQGETISLEDEEKYLDDMLNQIEARKRVQVLVFVGDRLAGNAEISLESDVREHVGSLGIAVAQPYRGQGVGELLMRTIIDEASAHLPGMKMVMLMVFGNNQTGQNLYRKVGFVEHGRLPGGILHRDHYVDAVYMYKMVNGLAG